MMVVTTELATMNMMQLKYVPEIKISVDDTDPRPLTYERGVVGHGQHLPHDGAEQDDGQQQVDT